MTAHKPAAQVVRDAAAGRKEGWFFVGSGVAHVNGRSLKFVGTGAQIG